MAVLNFLNATEHWSLILKLVFWAHKNNAAAMAACMQLMPKYSTSKVLAMIDMMIAIIQTILEHLMWRVAKKEPKHM